MLDRNNLQAGVVRRMANGKHGFVHVTHLDDFLDMIRNTDEKIDIVIVNGDDCMTEEEKDALNKALHGEQPVTIGIYSQSGKQESAFVAMCRFRCVRGSLHSIIGPLLKNK